jgi:hypothetical protein
MVAHLFHMDGCALLFKKFFKMTPRFKKTDVLLGNTERLLTALYIQARACYLYLSPCLDML